MTEQENDLITLTADIVGAHVAHNNVSVDELAGLIQSVHGALKGLGVAPEPVAEKQEPAVSIRSSVKPDHIVCLEDGKKLKMLKRYLRTNYDMSPDEYRRKWGLPSDYPMVAPNYAEKRRTLAHSIGLGRKAADVSPAEPIDDAAVEATTDADSAVTEDETIEVAKPKRAARKPKADAAGYDAPSATNDGDGEATPRKRGRKPKAAAE